MYDTSTLPALPAMTPTEVTPQLSTALACMAELSSAVAGEQATQRPRRGRPRTLSEAHLWLGLLWAVLEGLSGYRALTRYLATHALGHFAPVNLTDSAVLQRLQQAGLDPLHELFATFGAWLHGLVTPPACALAPFASQILAVDETKLDAVVRRLPWQRQHRPGDPALLAGKLAALFDIRAQRWLRVQYVAEALRNCKQDVLPLLEELPWRSLLLFDLGYFSFPLFDYLTERGYYWISRYRERTCYQLLHVYYRHGVILDAVVWLGSAKGPHAARAVRLVRFGDGKQVRMYFTNVLDPLQLPMGDIARLYARRWDIELAFLTLKALLGLHHWWSSQRCLLLQQLCLVLLLAQVVQALRLQIATQAGCDPFDVSLPLLVQHLPHLLRARHEPGAWVLTYGHTQHFLRPSCRQAVVAPSIPADQLTPLSPELPLLRKARYVTYRPRPPHRSYNKNKPSTSKRPSLAKEPT